ncbi:MAG: hypothetical protein J3Q66DRAFT_326902 [Benniella sp.]|nr:MAG: hypothetical protein J3Q66DRAFT_326902 [Benniella sp.]
MDRKVMNVTCNEGIKTRALLTLLSSLPSSTSLPCHPNISLPGLDEGGEGQRVVGHPLWQDPRHASSVRWIPQEVYAHTIILGSILSFVGRHPHTHDRPGQGFPAKAVAVSSWNVYLGTCMVRL